MEMSNEDLRRYIQQMLSQLAELADSRSEDDRLCAIAFELRLIAEKAREVSWLTQAKPETAVLQ